MPRYACWRDDTGAPGWVVVRHRLVQLREVFGDALDDDRGRPELTLALLASPAI